MADANSRSPRSRRSLLARKKDDSPARQIQFDLERKFSQIQLHEIELQKVHAYNRRTHQEELDARELAQAKIHKEEIDLATEKHELVRKQALAVLKAYLEEEDFRRRKAEEAEKQRQFIEAQRKAEEERRLLEQKRIREEQERKAREEAERKAQDEIDRKAREEKEKEAANARKVAEAEARAKASAEAEAAKRRDSEARKQKETEAAKLREQASASAAKSQITTSARATTKRDGSSSWWDPDPEQVHKKYLQLHASLKQFRKDFWEMAKKDRNLKPVVGDMRRAIRTSVGQLTDDKVGNKKANERVKVALLKALREIPSPPVKVNDYLPDTSLLDKNTTEVPSLVIYLLSVFSKAVFNAFAAECAVNPKAAEPIGTLVAQVFSMPQLQFKRNVPSPDSGIHYQKFGGDVPTPPMKPESCSLVAILICKFHASAPPLFGISGPDTTVGGRARLGWRKEYPQDGATEKKYVTEQRQYDRLTGIGAGYTSVALRNFSKVELRNPYPPSNFWSSLARIMNTPPSEVQVSHLILLKSMLENNAIDRFILFFGAPAIALLREVLIYFPQRLPAKIGQTPAAKSLVLLAEALQKDKRIHLT